MSSITPNLTLHYRIQRNANDGLVNTTIQLPFLNRASNNSVQLIQSNSETLYNVTTPFPYDSSSNVAFFANFYDPGTEAVTNNVTINTTTIGDADQYANGTIMVQSNSDAGTLNSGSVRTYPIHYAIDISPTLTSYMKLIISIQNDYSVLSVLDRLKQDINSQQTLKTIANKKLETMASSYTTITPSLFRFHVQPYGYHNKTANNYIRLDLEYKSKSKRHTVLVESVNTNNRANIRDIQVVLPENAPVDYIYPIVIYRRVNSGFIDTNNVETLPNISIGRYVSSAFTEIQSIQLENELGSRLNTHTVGGVQYQVEVRGITYSTDTESWKVISYKPRQLFKSSNIVLKKDNHIQKHFLANDNEIQLSYNGSRLQALSTRGSQIQFVTAKQYFSSVSNVPSLTRIVPARYFNLNRSSYRQNVAGYVQFEDLMGTGDIFRLQGTSEEDVALSNATVDDVQQIVSIFGNTTSSFGNGAYKLDGSHTWQIDMPFKWNEFIQSDSNLTLFTPNSGLSGNEQTLNISQIWNMKLLSSAIFNSIPITYVSYNLPNTTSNITNILDVQLFAKTNTTIISNYDLVANVTSSLGVNYTKPVLTNIPNVNWNRIGIDYSLVLDKSGSNWQVRDVYTRAAAYEIPNDTLDDTQRVSLTKATPSSAFYMEANVTNNTINPLDAFGILDSGNTTISVGIGSAIGTDTSFTDQEIYLDELEYYRGLPIHTNVLGGVILNNAFH